jgi:hypothetical protein
MTRPRSIPLLLLLLLTLPAPATDHFLTIGGGASPQSNQLSLERNVLYYQRVLGETGHGDAPHDVYFACGNSDQRDLQIADAAHEPPRVNLLLARLFGRDEELYQSYRPHEMKNLKGPAIRVSINKWFNTTGKRLADGDRLLVYFTGHGSGGPGGSGPGGGRGRSSSQPTTAPSSSNAARNTTMDLWQDGGMRVTEFTALLNQLNPKVKVVLVMVQCHSGGFADVIFKDGAPGPVLAEPQRCGFFATWHDRLAAGCTPDTVEENYREYSTYFLAALSGKTRTGQPITPPDYDQDGRTSLAEAHAYTQVTSETIDIPVCTSDVLLRQFSKTRDDKVKGLVTTSTPFDQLAKAATPDRRAALEGLSKSLDLKGNDRGAAARTLAETISRERRDLERNKSRLNQEREQLRRQLRAAVQAKWPEMSNAFHPAVVKAITNESDQIINTIESHSAYAKWNKLGEEIEEITEKSFELERKWVKAQRFIYVAESVALAANLDKFANKLVQERYKTLRVAENGLFWQPRRASGGAPQAP